MLVADAGAEQLAEPVGIPCCDPLDLVVPRERERWQRAQSDPSFAIEDVFRGHDTVGALALDADGNIAAAISTGGVPNTLHGRVGDTPLIGCGLYADNEAGVCCATGLGESIIRAVLSKAVVDRLEHLDRDRDAGAASRGHGRL